MVLATISCLYQPALDGWCGQYLDDRLYFRDTHSSLGQRENLVQRLKKKKIRSAVKWNPDLVMMTWTTVECPSHCATAAPVSAAVGHIIFVDYLIYVCEHKESDLEAHMQVRTQICTIHGRAHVQCKIQGKGRHRLWRYTSGNNPRRGRHYQELFMQT